MHVLNYCTLRHLSTGISDAEVAHLVQCLYEAIVPSDTGSPKGSPLKLEKVQNGTPFVKALAADHPMGHLLAELSALCRIHYESTALSKPSTCNSSPGSSMCARGSYCGAQSILPDYDRSVLLDEPPDERKLGLSLPSVSSNPTLSPFQDHDRVVGACMRAIRKNWPRVDRRPVAARGHPLVRRSSQLTAKRTWSHSDYPATSEPEYSCKRARRNSVVVRSRVSPRRSSGC